MYTTVDGEGFRHKKVTDVGFVCSNSNLSHGLRTPIHYTTLQGSLMADRINTPDEQ